MHELVASFDKLKIEIITPASALDELADLCQQQWSFTDSAPAPMDWTFTDSAPAPTSHLPTPIMVEGVPDCEDPELKDLKCVFRNRRPGAHKPFMAPIKCRPPTPIVVEDVTDCEDPELKALKCVFQNHRPGANEPFMVPIECK